MEWGSKRLHNMSISAVAGEHPYLVKMDLTWLGPDVHILVGGGTHPHIGAVAAAYWDGEATHVWCRQFPHHKEGELAQLIAERICMHLQCNVSVAIGIHVDHATKEEIHILVKNCEEALERLLLKLEDSLI